MKRAAPLAAVAALAAVCGCTNLGDSPLGSARASSRAQPVPLPAPHAADVEDPAAARDRREQPLATEPWGPEVFRERRARVLEKMKSGVALVLAATKIDAENGARQDADFLYLTGLADEAGAGLILAPDDPQREILLLASLEVEADRWVGARAMLPSRDLEVRTGFAHIRRMNGMGYWLSLLASHSHDLHFFGPVVGFQTDVPKVLDLYGKTAQRVPGAKTKDSIGLLDHLRMVKEPRELEKIQRATDVSVAGHLEAMRRVRPGMREWELKQIVEDAFRKGGARRLAYGSIVGAGPDGCVLHYPKDDRTIADGELVLIDAGAELDHYATDITRTFPSSGKFSPEQRKIYDVVLKAQNAAIAHVRPGVTFDELQDAAAKVIADAGYYDYFIHGIGHHVGLEVHDLSGWAAREPIAEGSVITVEPGIYMPGRRIGVRIEDTLLVTARGARLLSGQLPRDADAIEQAMAKH